MTLRRFVALLGFWVIICKAGADHEMGLRVPREVPLEGSFEDQADAIKELQHEYRQVYVSAIRFLESLNSSFPEIKSRLAVLETTVIHLNQPSASTCSCPESMGPPGRRGPPGNPGWSGIPGLQGKPGRPGSSKIPYPEPTQKLHRTRQSLKMLKYVSQCKNP